MEHSNDTWQLAAILQDGHHKIYRYRQLNEHIARSAYPCCVLIDWTYGEGLPDKSVNALFGQFETSMQPLDHLDGVSQQVMVITGKGVREWCYYVSNYDDFMAKLNQCLQGQPRYPIRIEFSEDAGWTYFEKITTFVDELPLDSDQRLDLAGLMAEADQTGQTATNQQATGADQPAAASSTEVPAQVRQQYGAAAIKIARSLFSLMHSEAPRYRPAQLKAFPLVHANTFERLLGELRTQGFKHHLDCESESFRTQYGKRALTRFVFSADGETVVSISQIEPVGSRLLLRIKKLLGNLPEPTTIIDMETHFSDGTVTQTNNVDGRNPFTTPPSLRTHKQPPSTTIAALWVTHSQDVAAYLAAHPGVTVLGASSLDDVEARAETVRKIKNDYRRSIDGFTRDELNQLARNANPPPEFETLVREAMQAMIAEHDAAQTVPEWAPPVSISAYRHFLALVRADFERQGQTISIDDGIVRIKGGSSELGLANLLQLCHQAQDQEKWPHMIAEHFSRLRSGQALAEKFSDKTLAFDEIRDQLAVRLYPADQFTGELGKQAVLRSDIDGTVSVLVIDTPENVITVMKDMCANWGHSEDALFALGLDWLRRDQQIELGKVEITPGAEVTMIAGDGFFTASRALILDQFPELSGSHGSLICIPHRHALIAYPIENQSVAQVLPSLIQAASGMHKQGPGSITPEVYWYRNRKFLRITNSGGKTAVVSNAFMEFVRDLPQASAH